MRQYISTKTGNLLAVKKDAFSFRGMRFSGLVDPETEALYDNPNDSLARYLKMPDALDKGLIQEYVAPSVKSLGPNN